MPWIIGGVIVAGIAGLALMTQRPALMLNPQGLTEAQRLAVLAYASEHGRNWKSDLSADWMRAAARVGGRHSAELQQIRNTLGPAWLNKVSLKDLATKGNPLRPRVYDTGKGDVKANYYVWIVGKPGEVYGPYRTLKSAKTFARIGATEGAHDRAVTRGKNPKNVVRYYQRGTGASVVH